MSLIEITIATMILSIVLLAAGSIYISSIRELNRCMDEAAVQKEASFVLDHIFLNLMGAKGLPTFNANSIVVTVDDSGTDKYIKYELSGDGKNVNFYPPSTTNPPTTYEVIASADTISLTFTKSLLKDPAVPNVYLNNYVTVDITVTRGRMTKTFSTGVVLRGMEG